MTEYHPKYLSRANPIDYHKYISTLFISALILAIVLFDRDAVSYHSSIGRMVVFDFVLFFYIIYFVIKMRITAYTFKIRLLSLFLISSVLLFGISGFLSISFSNLTIINSSSGISDSVRYLLYSIAILAISLDLKIHGILNKYVAVWLMSYTLVVLIGFAQILGLLGLPLFEQYFLWENIRHGDRIASTFRWQGPLVLFLGITIPLVSSYIIKGDEIQLHYVFLLVSGLLIGLISGSRAFLLMFAGIAVPFTVILSMKKMLYVFLYTFPLIMFISIYDFRALDRLDNRLQRLLFSPSEESRVGLWIDGFYLWRESMIFGVGPNQIREHIGNSTHNGYLGILYERGIIGALILVVYLISIIRMSLDMVKENNRYYFLSIGVLGSTINFIIYLISAEAVANRISILLLVIIIVLYENN